MGGRRTVAQMWLEAMLGAGMGVKVVEMLSMKMLVCGSTASSLQDRRYCAPLYFPVTIVNRRACLEDGATHQI